MINKVEKYLPKSIQHLPSYQANEGCTCRIALLMQIKTPKKRLLRIWTYHACIQTNRSQISTYKNLQCHCKSSCVNKTVKTKSNSSFKIFYLFDFSEISFTNLCNQINMNTQNLLICIQQQNVCWVVLIYLQLLCANQYISIHQSDFTTRYIKTKQRIPQKKLGNSSFRNERS